MEAIKSTNSIPTAIELLEAWAKLEPDRCIKSQLQTDGKPSIAYYRIVISQPIAHILRIQHIIQPGESPLNPVPEVDLSLRDLAMLQGTLLAQIERKGMRLVLSNRAEGWFATLQKGTLDHYTQHVGCHRAAALAILTVYLKTLSA